MYTIVGSGFGLYGYLPALVEGLGERVVLPRAYEAKVHMRAELSRAREGIQWVDDQEAALALADAVVIATPPARQLDVAMRCVEASHIRRLVLEKPLAPTPAQAIALLDALTRQGKRVRVGYTLAHAAWLPALHWPRAEAREVSIEWTFMAHHFAQGLSNWKRSESEGGGVLRFFGVHVLALLAREGYSRITRSRLTGDAGGEPKVWEAVAEGEAVPRCRVRVDSAAPASRFTIHAGREALLDLEEPFAQERPRADEDRRVPVLERLLRSFTEPDDTARRWYAHTNELWRQAEAQ